MAAVRAKDLRVLAPDGQLEALRMLVDHRDQLTNQRVATVNRMQALLAELTPGQAKKDITALQAKAILAGVRPRDLVGKTRRRVAADELANLMTIETKVKALTIEIKAIVQERRSNLMDLPGVGPVVAARILATSVTSPGSPPATGSAFWTGTAPLDASSGEQTRHRLSRAGNRRMNRMLHIAATTQIRLDTQGRRYYRSKLADGKTRMEAMRCLKRRISDAVYRQLVADAQLLAGAGPGGQCGASQESSAVDLPPHIDTSDQPLPGPATTTLQPTAASGKKHHHENPQQSWLTTESSFAPGGAARPGLKMGYRSPVDVVTPWSC